MKHCIYGTNLKKNKMERFVQKMIVIDYIYVYNWLKLYILYIHTKMDKTRFMEFLMNGG